jgi:hypothetical protein
MVISAIDERLFSLTTTSLSAELRSRASTSIARSYRSEPNPTSLDKRAPNRTASVNGLARARSM